MPHLSIKSRRIAPSRLAVPVCAWVLSLSLPAWADAPSVEGMPAPKDATRVIGGKVIKGAIKPEIKAADVEKPTDKPAEKAVDKAADKAVEKAAEKTPADKAHADKAGAKATAAPASSAEAKPPVSMSELRDMIDQKISEVRASRSSAPVLKVQSRGGRAAPAKSKAAAPHAVASTGAGPDWSYNGDTGPTFWATLKPEYRLCGTGQRQSPIDIRDGLPVQMDPITFDYKPSAFRVIDTGRTVSVHLEPGNRMTVNGRRYELQHVHFHRPSEERINGKQFAMSIHLEHQDLEGKTAVLALLIEEGAAHPVVQQVWNNLPLEKHVEQAAMQAMDLNHLLPEQRQYITYMGSETTPPCREGVLWLVMKQPLTATAEQINIFSRLYPMNARPVQPLAGRMIKDGQ